MTQKNYKDIQTNDKMKQNSRNVHGLRFMQNDYKKIQNDCNT